MKAPSITARKRNGTLWEEKKSTSNGGISVFAASGSHLGVENTIIRFVALNWRNFPGISGWGRRRSCRRPWRSSSCHRQLLFVTTFIRIINVGTVHLLSIWHRTIPRGWSPKLNESISLEVLTVEADLVPLVERTNGPDDCLRAIGANLSVQLIGCAQWPLVRHDTVAIHHCCIQKTDWVCVLLKQREIKVVNTWSTDWSDRLAIYKSNEFLILFPL